MSTVHETAPGVHAPPDRVPAAQPVVTRAQSLPFADLSWENFERLCHQLVNLDASVEYAARFGRQGDRQEGIDIFGRLFDGRYHCLQAKRHKSYSAANLRAAVDLFLEGDWAGQASRFTLATQASLQSTTLQEEIEAQHRRLKAHGISFTALGGEQLTDMLRAHPVLIDDFFGRSWVEALLGPNIAASLGERLDGAAFASVWSQLGRVYDAQFHAIDPGSFGSIADPDHRQALTLLERFHKPDILVREIAPVSERLDMVSGDAGLEGPSGATERQAAIGDSTRQSSALDHLRTRRLELTAWLRDGVQLVVTGEAGSGKSTLLRVLALDLLHDQSHFPELAERWGRHIPIYVPFARWSSEVARDGEQVGIKEVVRRSLQPILTKSLVGLLDRAIDERRILLLIDGLDEWRDEQAARSTLKSIVILVEAHGIPMIVSGRPRGLSQIGTLPSAWKRGSIAPLSRAQQSAIARSWFDRYAPGTAAHPSAAIRTDRFMAELARDGHLAQLAATPLLLIGAVTLALRGQILPRTRHDVYDELVKILLEVHPDRRATAAGDVRSRFQFAGDADQRRAALARLAFAVRETQPGGALEVTRARQIIGDFLMSSEGFELARAEALAAAREILSINSETQGLLVERAPREVGFVHASFEEYLCGEYVAGWPFARIEDFVRAHCGDGRWRNVIANLLGATRRRDEFTRLVEIIEAPEHDELLRFNKAGVLGDAAFGSAQRSPAVARRLATQTLDRVEQEDWPLARRDALATVLKGLSDPLTDRDRDDRLLRWAPAPAAHRASLVAQLGTWKGGDDLQRTLWQVLHDEDPGVQRSAAAAFASAFANHPAALRQLLDGISASISLPASIAMLESLALGWKDDPQARTLFAQALDSSSAEMRLIGALGQAEGGNRSERLRDEALRAHNFWSEVSYPRRELASLMLLKFWPDDEELSKGALQRASGNYQSPWEHDVAVAYLLESRTDRADIRAWVLHELGKQFPFNVMNDERAWSQVGRLAREDTEIRVAANQYWLDPEHRIIGMHKIRFYVEHVADEEIARMLIDVMREKAGFDQHWALLSLLTGWSRDDRLIKPALDELLSWTDERLVNLAALLPELMADKTEARERLLGMAKIPGVRADLVARGLELCGCGPDDDGAVNAILSIGNGAPAFEPSSMLFRTFSTHPAVRTLAVAKMEESEAPLAAIAAGYEQDDELRALLLRLAVPLPADLRAQIVEVAAVAGQGTILEQLLTEWPLEQDNDLRVRMAIAHYESLVAAGTGSEAVPELLAKAVALGPAFEGQRAAALAGLTVIGELKALERIEDRGKPIRLTIGSFTDRIPTLERLICAHFREFQEAFGDSFGSRFDELRGGSTLPGILSEAAAASPPARAAFLALAEQGEMPLSAKALRALAAERPRSELLLERCFDFFARRHQDNRAASENGEVGLILRANFPRDQAIASRLADQFARTRSTPIGLALAIHSPSAAILADAIDPHQLGQDFGDWAMAIHVAAEIDAAGPFQSMVEAMLTRRWRSQFDAQAIINIAVQDRLQNDITLQEAFTARLDVLTDPTVSASIARFLAAAGRFSTDARAKALAMLADLRLGQSLPQAAYDALSDRWRTTREILLDAVYGGLDLA